MKFEEMVQELWDREKIKELTYEYGLAIETQDAERMVNGKWKFTSRRVEMFYFVPLSEGWAKAEGPGKL